jgi:hypothetical protein
LARCERFTDDVPLLKGLGSKFLVERERGGGRIRGEQKAQMLIRGFGEKA